MYKISLLIALIICMPLSQAMLPAGIQTDGYVVKVPTSNLRVLDPKITRVTDPRQNLHNCLAVYTNGIPPVVIAAEQGNLEEVQAYFNSWKRYIAPWDHYHQEVALLLGHAARFPAEKTGSVVRFLLEKVTFSEITKPDCLLKNALAQGHEYVIPFLATHAPELMRWELMDAIIHEKDTNLASLLKAGVDPNRGVGDPTKEVVAREEDGHIEIAHGVQYPLHTAIFRAHANSVRLLLQHGASSSLRTHAGDSPLDIALRGITKHKDTDTTATLRRRLYIVRTVLNAMKDENIPSLEYVQEKIAPLAQETQSKIVGLLSLRITQRPCMSDEAPTMQALKQEVSFKELICLFGSAWCFGLITDIMMNWRKLRDEYKKTE